MRCFPTVLSVAASCSGKYRTEADTEDRARGAGVRPLITPQGLRLLDTIDAIAQEHDVRAAAIAVAWLMHRPTVTAPLASATSGAQLDDLLAAQAVTLDEAQVTRLDTASEELALRT